MSKYVVFSAIILAASLFAGSLSAAILMVPADYATIQSAIDAASMGDTVMVGKNNVPNYYNFPYHEQIVVNKRIALIGAGGVIAGLKSGDAVLVTAESCFFKKLTISGSGDYQPSIGSWDAGIKLKYADSCIIDSCKILGNAAGLVIEGSNHCQVTHNTIINNKTGIYFYSGQDGYGEIHSSSENHVFDNKIIYNHVAGIMLSQGEGLHQDNIIQDNYFVYNMLGLSMRTAQNSNITDNCFNLCIQYAIYEFEGYGEGGSNQISHNAFINNYSGNIHSFCFLAESQPSDLWSENFWSDYNGEDNNGDGFGDTPYILDGGSCQDALPLMAASDFDLDTVPDDIDNCPADVNTSQHDSDGDGMGDACEFHCGDADFSRSVNILDIVYIINYLYHDGPPPIIDGIADVNDNGATNILDIIYIMNYLYKGGPDTNCPLWWHW